MAAIQENNDRPAEVPVESTSWRHQLTSIQDALNAACQVSEVQREHCESLRQRLQSSGETAVAQELSVFARQLGEIQLQLTSASASADECQLKAMTSEQSVAQREKALQDSCSEWRHMVLESQQRGVELQEQLAEAQKGMREARKSLRQSRSGFTDAFPASCCAQLEREIERMKQELLERKEAEQKAQRVAEKVQQQLQQECDEMQKKLIRAEAVEAKASLALADAQSSGSQLREQLTAAKSDLVTQQQSTSELRRLVLEEQQRCSDLQQQLAEASRAEREARRAERQARSFVKQSTPETPSTPSSIEGEQSQDDLMDIPMAVCVKVPNVDDVQLACKRLHTELTIAKNATDRAQAAHDGLEKIQHSLQEEHSSLQ